MSKKEKEYEVSTGNIFEDLGLENSDELLARSNLLLQVSSLIKSSGLTQTEVGEKLGITQPKVSLLMGGRLSAFSSESLHHYLSILRSNIEIPIKKP